MSDCCSLPACWSPQSFAVAGAGRQALDDFLDGLTTLQAKFEQSALDSENATTGLMHGLFVLQRPGKFRWDYVAPRKQVILADGRDVWIIEEELKQVTQHYQRWALKGYACGLSHHRAVGRQGTSRSSRWVSGWACSGWN